MSKPRHRLATDHPLSAGASIALEGNAAHYLAQVLRMKMGDSVALFNRTDGEWIAQIAELRKRDVQLTVTTQSRAPAAMLDFWVCFAPIKGGRMETIIEKATELGAALLQPVITQRTIVDKVNIERSTLIAKEAAEQCERIDWPEIAAPKKLAALLGYWPKDRLLIYGDETGEGQPIAAVLQAAPTQKWAILAGPEGGFTTDELALLKRCAFAKPVSLGPRILRADTAIITLAALTLSAWGDWQQPPRYTGATP